MDEHVIDTSLLEGLLAQGLTRSFVIVVALVLFSFTFYAISYKAKRLLRNTSSLFMFGAFLFTWILGFITYSVGSHVDVNNPFLSSAPMAIIHATLMFAAQSDISAIKSDCFDSAPFMCLFNISHILAVLVSFALVLRHFGFHIVSKLRLAYIKCLGGKKDHLYIFWGFNDAAFSLAKSLLSDADRRHTSRVLVVRTNDEEESVESQMDIKRLFRVISLKNRELDRLERLDCLNVSSFARLSKLDLDATEGKEWDVFSDMLHLSCIPQLMKKAEQSVSFFLLSDSYEANYKALENLLGDASVIRYEQKANIYCHARRNQLTDIYNMYEKYNPNRICIHVLDSSELSVKCLKSQESALPISHLDIDVQHACITNSFKATIIGFGETGQDALSFLYEYSALPQIDGQPIKRHFTIVDKRSPELEAEFWFSHPGIHSEDHEIEFVQADICNNGFYEGLEKDIKGSQYFVIALDDEELNMQLATTIFDSLYRSDKRCTQKISIYVKTYSQDKLKWMKRIANNKNTGDKDFPCTIHVFGSIDDIFTYDLIIANSILEKAKLYNWTYECVCSTKSLTESPDNIWISSFGSVDRKIKTYQEKGKNVSRAEVAQEILRKTEQNISNALHISTKLRLIGVDPTDRHTLNMLNNLVRTRKKYHLEYYDISSDNSPILSEWNERLLNCAKCEHLRWNASHLMMGYKATASFSDTTSDRTKQHNCLRTWEELNDATRSYDSCVVDTSIRMANK